MTNEPPKPPAFGTKQPPTDSMQTADTNIVQLTNPPQIAGNAISKSVQTPPLDINQHVENLKNLKATDASVRLKACILALIDRYVTDADTLSGNRDLLLDKANKLSQTLQILIPMVPFIEGIYSGDSFKDDNKKKKKHR